VRLGKVRLGRVRLGKDRLGKVRLGKVRLGKVRLIAALAVLDIGVSALADLKFGIQDSNPKRYKT